MAREERPLVFLGTPTAAAVVLEELIANNFPIAHVVTKADARRGRGGKTSPSPVKQVALAHHIPVSHDVEWIKKNSDTSMLGIVVAFGRIISEDVLQKTPMINIHFSLLPRWRGAAPVERAILAGDKTTGVCIMDVEKTLDTGAVYASAQMSISPTATTESLTAELSQLGAQLLVNTLKEGLSHPIPQSGETTYAEKISPEEGRINWNDSSELIDRQVRALRSFTDCDGLRVRIHEVVPATVNLGPGEVSKDACVGTGNGSLRLVLVQPEGKPVMDALAWLRGRPNTTQFTVSQ